VRILARRHEELGRGQAERLFPMLSEVLDEAGCTLADLDAVAVGTGPGNFTGLRIAVSAARGLALSLERPAIGIPIHEALAEGLPRPLLASIDARRDRVYLQLFGEAPRGPEMVTLETVDGDWAASGLTVTGHEAEGLALRLGGTMAPAQPPAPAIARAASRQLARNPARMDWPRPAPLYLRPADAAPSADRGPVMIP
jgi:tRNA threonylcarbamoyl adenosine modification protein YeaZ